MILFEWDEEKEWENYLKHKIRFSEAEVIWADEFAIEFYDDHHSEQEHRFIRVGLHPNLGTLLVVFCERKTFVRIISARKTTKVEKEFYEKSIRLK